MCIRDRFVGASAPCCIRRQIPLGSKGSFLTHGEHTSDLCVTQGDGATWRSHGICSPLNGKILGKRPAIKVTRISDPLPASLATTTPYNENIMNRIQVTTSGQLPIVEPIQEISSGNDNAGPWLASFARHGVNAPSTVRGEFSVAIEWPDGKTFCAVDRFAIRSLCYRVTGGRLEVAERADDLAGSDTELEMCIRDSM